MKPTDEERRKVARRLRESRSFVDGLGKCGMTQNALDTFERILECVGYETGNVFDFLADLVEPAPERTCRVLTEKRTFSQTQEIHIKLCSACGRMFGAEKHCQLLPGLDEESVLDDVQIPSYCPLCGAKVIEEES